MKIGFYPKLALSGMRKNKRFYFPYFLTCVGMVMMFYIIVFLAYCPLLLSMKGGSNVLFSMSLGRFVLAVFSVIFLFYTNSFLMRRRKKEFGLYNVLGMDKRNIGRLLFWETLMIGMASLFFGIVFGIVFSKLAELGLLNMLRLQVDYTLYVSYQSILQTVILFAVIFLLIFARALWQIKLSNPLKLMNEESVGEKAPKVNWLFAVLGVILLGAAYYIAVSIQNPLTAMMIFFVAVIMVIIATYLLFVSGSVAFCRLLQKKKSYYYKAKHFISVSSMVYRMKRNGAGLASICILSTMVLVMISSTTSLYIGAEDSIRSRYPRNIGIEITVSDMDSFLDDSVEAARNIVENTLQKYGAGKDNVLEYRTASITGQLEEDGRMNIDAEAVNEFDMTTYDTIYAVYLMPLEDYNNLMGTRETLNRDEALVACSNGKYQKSTIAIHNSEALKVKKSLDEYSLNPELATIPSMIIVVSDIKEFVEPFYEMEDRYDNRLLRFNWYYGFNTNVSDEIQIQMKNEIRTAVREESMQVNNGIYAFGVDSEAENREDFYLTYGGLFFLGILLSFVFVAAAILMIYYKQISEGYEDEARFEIMQKVGMTKKDIKKSINSQILTVFFAPLLLAGLHQAFAFPLIWKILQLFMLNNLSLVIIVTVISFLIFALCYCLIYKKTSNVYYSIVSGAREK